jgi:hypothetical protein
VIWGVESGAEGAGSEVEDRDDGEVFYDREAVKYELYAKVQETDREVKGYRIV